MALLPPRDHSESRETSTHSLQEPLRAVCVASPCNHQDTAIVPISRLHVEEGPELSVCDDTIQRKKQELLSLRVSRQETSKASTTINNETTRASRLYSSFRSGSRHRILHFTPSWFSVNMGTGISSILLYTLPFENEALKQIGVVIFLLNVGLFITFVVMSLLRYLIWPNVFHSMINHPVQSLFLGTFAMGFDTIINMIVLVCAQHWHGHWITLAWSLWWINSVFTAMICFGLPWMMFTRQKHSIEGLSAVWLLPIVTAVVHSSSGGIVASVLSPSQARLTVVASYIIWGAGILLALLILSLYFLRLSIHNVPPKEQIVSVFLPLGPCGQGAFALLQLSSQVRRLAYEEGVGLFGSNTIGIEEGKVVATAIYAGSVIVALAMWGFGLFWLCTAVATIGDMMRKGGFPFNMGWWGFTFPLGVYALATNALGSELDSTAFKVIGTLFSGCVVSLWLFVAVRTSIRAFTGTMFIAPCLGPQS